MLQLLLETPEFEDFEAAIEDLEVQTSLHFYPYLLSNKLQSLKFSCAHVPRAGLSACSGCM